MLKLALWLLSFSIAADAWAAVAEPSVSSNLSLMRYLSDQDLHDFSQERWNVYSQATYISSWKSGFKAKYTNLNGSTNSLSTDPERSFTGTFTAYFGLRLWPGAELYVAPEVVSLEPLSDLHGLGGAIQNFELQKTGAPSPVAYLSRAYLRQSWEFVSKEAMITSGPLQLGKTVAANRFTLTLGNLSVLDVFDKNTYAGDLRQQFFNMAFLSYAAYDFAADARGYSWGITGELAYGDWTLRAGRFITPVHPNVLPLDFDIFRYYGDQMELEHRHIFNGQPGVVRILFYRNRENMGRWDDAIAALRQDPAKNAANCVDFNYGSANNNAPDLCWVRRPNVKVGGGINVEQRLNDYIGLFFRGMISDGATEVYSYLSADRSVAFGGLMNGVPWGRPEDTFGLGYALSWISAGHADYLRLGGIDGFIGDGSLSRAAEQVLDVFYNFHALPSLWLTADYQHITNPAYNSDRGPVDIYGLRAHIEF